MDSYEKLVYMVGYDEDSNEVVLATYVGDFMLQLDSRRFRRFSKSKKVSSYKYHDPISLQKLLYCGYAFVPRVTRFSPIAIGICLLYYCFYDFGVYVI
jgi:hypothetical protein